MLYEIREILLIVLVAIIFSMALASGKRFFAQFKVPESVTMIVLYVTAFLTLSYFLYSLLPIITEQYQVFLDTLPETAKPIKEITEGTIFEGVIEQSVKALEDSPKQLFQLTGSGIFALFGGLVNLVLFFLLTTLFAMKPKVLDDFLYVITPSKYRKYVNDLWGRVQKKISRWFQGQVLLMAIIAVLTYMTLIMLGIPNALFLSVFAGVTEIIPIFGPIIGAIPAVLMAWTTGDISTVLWVIAMFAIIQQLENNVIYPLVLGKIIGVSSILIILAAVIGGSLAGFVGIIVSVPLAVTLQEFFTDVKSGKLKKVQKARRR